MRIRRKAPLEVPWNWDKLVKGEVWLSFSRLGSVLAPPRTGRPTGGGIDRVGRPNSQDLGPLSKEHGVHSCEHSLLRLA